MNYCKKNARVILLCNNNVKLYNNVVVLCILYIFIIGTQYVIVFNIYYNVAAN